jgi:Uncharacterized conserved protein
MPDITIVAVGKLKEAYWAAAVGEYQKRLGAYCNCQIIEIPEYRLPAAPSGAQIQRGLEAEGEHILAKIPPRAQVFALCIEGAALSSEQLSKTLENALLNTSKIAFIIGSSHGIAQSVKQAAHFRLSLSAMTLPHQLARVVLCEQLYRAMSILHQGKYHK